MESDANPKTLRGRNCFFDNEKKKLATNWVIAEDIKSFSF